jgi:hypothetical protein
MKAKFLRVRVTVEAFILNGSTRLPENLHGAFIPFASPRERDTSSAILRRSSRDGYRVRFACCCQTLAQLCCGYGYDFPFRCFHRTLSISAWTRITADAYFCQSEQSLLTAFCANEYFGFLKPSNWISNRGFWQAYEFRQAIKRRRPVQVI